MAPTPRELLVLVARWLGRILALLLVLFWGAFFVEHLREWYLRPDGRYPPAWVGLSMALHFAMLVGLLVMLRREWLGTILTVLGTTAFFATLGFRSFPTISLLNLLPVTFFALAWLLARSSAHPASEPPPLPPPLS